MKERVRIIIVPFNGKGCRLSPLIRIIQDTRHAKFTFTEARHLFIHVELSIVGGA